MKFYKLVLTLSGIILSLSLPAQLPNVAWVKQLGDGPQNVDGWGITADNSGDVICWGLFYATADFDPGPGAFNMTAAGIGGEDHYLCKLGHAFR